MICFTPFFFAGYYLDRKKIEAIIALKKWPIMLIAGIVLLSIFAVVFYLYAKTNYITEFRGILTARNSYAILESLEPKGALIRGMWYIVAVFMSICVILIVPVKKYFFTKMGEKTLQLYIWHLFALRLLACVSFIPFVNNLSESFLGAKLIPVVTALLVVICFSFKPPFGLIIELIQKEKKYMELTKATKIIILLLFILIVAASLIFSAT